MSDSTWKIWAVIAVLTVGGTFELFKHMPSEKSPLWEKENLHFSDSENTPYSVRETKHATRPAAATHKNEIQPVHVAANNVILQDAAKTFEAENAPKATEADPKDAAKAKKKKKSDDEYEEVIDPVTGKKVRRKKKKDAKKDEKPKEEVAAQPVEVQAPPLQDQQPPPDDMNAAIGAALAEAANGGAITPAPTNPPQDPFASLEEWERLLLQRPDLNATKQFIADYNSHTVTADIYFKITQMMLQDSRPEMKQLGVLCAGSAPSTTSFQLLVGVAKSAGGTLAQQANSFLSAYSQSDHLIYLQGALHSSNSQVAVAAAQTLDTAVQHALQTQSQNPSGDPRAQTGAAAANRTQFQSFVAILNQLSQSTQDATLAAQARQTLADLRSLIGDSTSNLASTP